MTIATLAYPTTQEVADKVCERLEQMGDKDITTEWLDEFIYDIISEYDHLFIGDDKWFNEDGDDIKDELRDNIMSAVLN